ncbi:unnamed protein product [Soboliphyme baturini]|uniref:Low-density lipoprotein receptor domain class A n=1 Tax=Soboliphyme baturini TaxID=241478 RepID=A0A183IL80_9BILA|nr:unnamed protein product [Soboliphyme baturini]
MLVVILIAVLTRSTPPTLYNKQFRCQFVHRMTGSIINPSTLPEPSLLTNLRKDYMTLVKHAFSMDTADPLLKVEILDITPSLGRNDTFTVVFLMKFAENISGEYTVKKVVAGLRAIPNVDENSVRVTDVQKACRSFLENTALALIDHCSDTNADYEPGCIQECLDDYFYCAQTKVCLRPDQRCNGVFECGLNDTSDEKDCKCSPVQFRCNNGLCLSRKVLCDNKNDCGSWEDEKNCTCKPDFLQCTGTGQCYNQSKWCDYHADCGDLSDETNCINATL